jgi:hypothetical protein
VPKYSIAYLVPGSITYAFEIVCLIAHTTYYTGIAQKINEFGDTTFYDRKWDPCKRWSACDHSPDSLLLASN